MSGCVAMGFFSFQLTKLDPKNIRSRTTDIDLVTFGVLVNNRDQGHGYATFPMWPGLAVEYGSFNDGAALNGLAFGGDHMNRDWVIGPLYVEDNDRVDVVYTATNLSDANLPSMSQQEADKWAIKTMNIYYSLLVGEFISGIGLSALADYIGARAAEAAAAFLADPVGTLLGYKPPGHCNGTVFSDKKSFTGATLAALPSTPGTERTWGREVKAWWSELTEHYSDEATHNPDMCGATAQTDVTIKITRYQQWSMKAWSGQSYEAGWRRFHPAAHSFMEVYGLRI
jgi:hypothetical protein